MTPFVESERWFDEWMRSPIPHRAPQSDQDRILDAYMDYVEAHCDDPAWCAEQDAMYWEGRQGEPCTMEEFWEDSRREDQYWYEVWLEESREA